MQEVAKLRRSLDDAEGLSRDTKKEWAVLRSQNISLEERMVSPQKSPDCLLEMVKMKNGILSVILCVHLRILSRSP